MPPNSAMSRTRLFAARFHFETVVFTWLIRSCLLDDLILVRQNELFAKVCNRPAEDSSVWVSNGLWDGCVAGTGLLVLTHKSGSPLRNYVNAGQDKG